MGNNNAIKFLPSEGIPMFNGSIVGAIATLLFFVVQVFPARGATKLAKVEVGGVKAIPQVYVPLSLHTSDEQLFVPYCGGWNEEKLLCTSATAHLEVYTKKGWEPAELKTSYAVFGAPPINRASGILIAPNSSAAFTFQFSTLFFNVARGQQLRVIVDTWHDEQSMRAGKPSIALSSAPFKCPGLVR
jgi:hypothetical protein